VLRIIAHLSIVLAAAAPAGAATQAPPAQYFAVCVSQPSLPTVYFSGVLQSPPAAFQALRNDFTAYLIQHYSYKGVVVCAPAANAVAAQSVINGQTTALRKAKRTVVETGWTESATAAVPGAAPTAGRKAGVQGGPAAGGGTNAGTGGSSDLTSILGAVFGSGKHGGADNSSGNGVSANAQATGNNVQAANADAGLGSAQADSTKLVVVGCGRQNTQVACVTELTNQNQKNTLMQSTELWKDAFIVDDRGDRHPRTSGFFLNIDGDQRAQIDISYGKSTRFILTFDGVPAKVQKVALRSAAGGLDVEDIALVAADAGAASGK
jgi:hypothetical protein